MAIIDNLAKQNSEQWLLSEAIDQQTKDFIIDLIKNNIEQFNESFYRNLEFGAVWIYIMPQTMVSIETDGVNYI